MQAQIEQWNDFSATEIDANIARWLYPHLGYGVHIPPGEQAAVGALKRALGALNTHLACNTYLRDTSGLVVNQPNFRKILGEVKQAESIPFPQSKKPTEPAKPKAEPKKEVKKEEPRPQEEEAEPKPKPKNPLDVLPPGTMILDDWKRLYSNTKTNFREVAIKGHLARKYAFGKMLIIGSEAPFKVKGLWLFRGKEIPKFVMDETYDMELYEWKQVDINDEVQKERVSQMIEDYEPFEGEALLDAKGFK
ncbi:hypothetical protein K7X08_002632 [Anisodus acutangulus]|uniref:EF-1-gamma C-terminal domain-containing protein n=1 Tax=Anisodus acutangulus TaxID=402998 RepID=A0A9Q1LS41_9SOLA|nr:hypothetical protein K7X08_002632 [Anisodus acutangulus]